MAWKVALEAPKGRRGKIAIPPKLAAIAPVKEAGVPQKERIIWTKSIDFQRAFCS